MPKKFLLFAALACFLSPSTQAQTSNLALRLGPGMIVEDAHFGFAGAFDFKPGKAPLAFSPAIESASSEGLTRTYYGLNLVLTNRLDKTGVLFGAGLGSTHWSFESSSRNALVYDVLLGFRVKASQRIGIYGQGKFIVNSKTNEDTATFNNASERGNSAGVPDFLFDNDFVASAGIAVILR